MNKFKIIILLPLLFLIGCATNYIKGTEPKVCSLHNIVLTKMVVPLGYGLPAFYPSDYYYKVKDELFPNSYLEAHGGCVLGFKEFIFPGRSKAKVLACEACNEAEKEWLKNHRMYDETP